MQYLNKNFQQYYCFFQRRGGGMSNDWPMMNSKKPCKRLLQIESVASAAMTPVMVTSSRIELRSWL